MRRSRHAAPEWMRVTPPGHHVGGIHDPARHLLVTPFRNLWLRHGEPPPGPGPVHTRPTIVHGAIEPAGRPRRPTPWERIGVWLDRKLGWSVDSLPCREDRHA